METETMLENILEIRLKAKQAGETLNPAKAKRLATEALNEAAELLESVVIKLALIEDEKGVSHAAN